MKSLLCVKHLEDCDKRKLSKMGVKGQKRIVAGIYGSNNGVTKELGLTSSEDGDDFRAKLESLKETWELLAPGFHDWFVRTRATPFIDSVITLTREGSGVDGLFYNNAIKSLHATIKKTKPGKMTVVNLAELIKDTIEKQLTEEVRAICKGGEYRLSKEYRCFEVYIFFFYNQNWIYCNHDFINFFLNLNFFFVLFYYDTLLTRRGGKSLYMIENKIGFFSINLLLNFI